MFERHNVTFVSVTQQFNTTTSMGRLTLNILLSFAQFEREVIGERIRDKFAASRRKGMWMGGWPPLGCEIENRRLVVLEGTTLVVRIPMRFQRRGGRKRIVAPDGTYIAPESKPQPDGTLVKALARAWRWQRMLDDGVYASVSDIGDAENISKSYVSRILRLALLARISSRRFSGEGWTSRRCWSSWSGRCRQAGRSSVNSCCEGEGLCQCVPSAVDGGDPHALASLEVAHSEEPCRPNPSPGPEPTRSSTRSSRLGSDLHDRDEEAWLTVVVIGNATVDVSYDVPRLPAAGETVLARARRIDAGGKGLNQAIVARRAGAEVLCCAPLGHDAQAGVILERLEAEGFETDHLRRLAVPTDESLIFVAPSGENAIVSTAAAAHALDEAAVAPLLGVLQPADLLLMQGNLTRKVTAFCLDRALEAGARTMLNPAPIAFDYGGLWPAVGIAVVNEVESGLLTGIGDPTTAAQALRRSGVGTVVTTLGADGVSLADGDGERRVPAPRVEVVDTTGAGDVFCGVLAAAVEMRLDWDTALRWAVAAASASVTRRGTAGAFPSSEELLRLREEALAGSGRARW